METVIKGGKPYCKLHIRSVAEALGLSQKGSTPPIFVPVEGYMIDEDTGERLPLLDFSKIERSVSEC